MKNKTIDLRNYRGVKSSVFTGRPQGEHARDELGLDILDTSEAKIKFIIPSGTTAITPSFFLGLLYNSIKKLDIAKYKEKYSFTFEDQDPELVAILNENLSEGERYGLNSIEQTKKKKRFTNLFK